MLTPEISAERSVRKTKLNVLLTAIRENTTLKELSLWRGKEKAEYEILILVQMSRSV